MYTKHEKMKTRFLRRRTRRGEDVSGNLVVGLKYRVGNKCLALIISRMVMVMIYSCL